jgi:hypothetical protein
MPAVPLSIIDPVFEQFAELLPDRTETHPLGCHNPRIPDHVVFEKLVQVLVFGCAYEKIADERCSATTLRRRRDEWIACGAMERLREMVLDGYDRMIGLDLSDVAVDCCITKAPCGGEKAGRSPVDRGKGGLKRSVVVDGQGIPLGSVTTPANPHDSRLLIPTLDAARSLGLVPEGATVHLDRGYDSNPTRERLRERGLVGDISSKGTPAPLNATKRWVVERTNSWHNAHKKLLWCTERRARVVDFWVAFSAVIVIARRLVREGWTRYRWYGRPRRRP